MLSVFPSLLSWSQVSPVLIRLVLAAILIFWAYEVFFKDNSSTKAKIIGGIEGIAGILLLIGLWAQVAALIVAIGLFYSIGEKVAKKEFLTNGVNYYLVLLVLALSILITGPGILAFDLPL